MTSEGDAGVWAALTKWIKRKAPQLAQYEFSDNDDEVIGIGQASTRVYRATKRDTTEEFAIKVIHRKALSDDKVVEVKREMEIMRSLKAIPHENLVMFHEAFEDAKNFYIVMEIMDGGELFDQIAKRGSFTERDACIVMKQIGSAVQHLHSHGYIHRDIKPENVLCAIPDSLELVKLCDFGMTKNISEDIARTPCGTVNFVAPEVVLKHGETVATRKGYSFKADMWSIGVLMFMVLSGRPPFFDDTTNGILVKIRNGDFSFATSEWDYVSESAKDLIRECLRVRADERIDVSSFLRHAWMTEAMVPKQFSPKLMSPLLLREPSVPIKDYMKMMVRPESPRASFAGNGGAAPPPPAGVAGAPSGPATGFTGVVGEPEPILYLHMGAERFLKWTLGENKLTFELPEYYCKLKGLSFAGSGTTCQAWSDHESTDVLVRKVTQALHDPTVAFKAWREVYILKSLEHPNVITLLDAFGSPMSDVYLVTEHVEVSLRTLLATRPVTPSEAELLMHDLLSGAHAMHSAELVHRDLRPANLLIKFAFNQVCVLQIGDMSSVVSQSSTRPSMLSTSGQRNYRAPETLASQTSTAASDLWAIGTIMAETLSSKMLFSGVSDKEVFVNIIRLLGTPSEQMLKDELCAGPPLVEAVSKEVFRKASPLSGRLPEATPAPLADLLSQLVTYSPSARMTARSAMLHPALKKAHAAAAAVATRSLPIGSYLASMEEQRGVNWKNMLLTELDSFHETVVNPNFPLSL